MKILTIIILLGTVSCFGQDKGIWKERKPMTKSEIRKSFPYNKTETIQLVSFKYDPPVVQESDTGDIEVPIYQPEIPKTNGAVDLTKMFEVKTANKELTDKIYKILMNQESGHQPVEVAFCYEPRNGIVFLDKQNNILGYIEICFECLRYEAQPSKITVTTLYPEEYEALKQTFKEAGIAYGTFQNDN